MWTCPKCHEDVEDDFDLCWKCGTSQDGTENPEFRVESLDNRERLFHLTALRLLCGGVLLVLGGFSLALATCCSGARPPEYYVLPTILFLGRGIYVLFRSRNPRPEKPKDAGGPDSSPIGAALPQEASWRLCTPLVPSAP